MPQPVKPKVSLKICGLQRLTDVECCLKLGVPWLGFNFYPQSRRYLAPTAARQLWLAAGGPSSQTQAVGVVVNATAPDITTLLATFPELKVLQLHGDESRDFVQTCRTKLLAGRALWKAVAIAGEQHVRLAESWVDIVDKVLLDAAHVPSGQGVAGGSGMRFSWAWLDQWQRAEPFALAGGIGTDNMAEALALGADLLDIASGAEDGRPGHKSPEKIAKLVATWRQHLGG